MVIVDEDVSVRRVSGERCLLSALTGSYAVIVLGPSMRQIRDVFELPTPDADGDSLVVGIRRLAPIERCGGLEVVYDDAHATPALLDPPGMPVAYVVRGVTPLGPPVVGEDGIRRLLTRVGARGHLRVSGAIALGDLSG